MIAITGASGNTGRVVAESLLAQGEKVRVIGRDAGRLAPLVQKGAEAFVADITDEPKLAQGFAGAQGVYAMLPPNITADDVSAYQNKVTDAVASLFRKLPCHMGCF